MMKKKNGRKEQEEKEIKRPKKKKKCSDSNPRHHGHQNVNNYSTLIQRLSPLSHGSICFGWVIFSYLSKRTTAGSGYEL